MASGDAPRLGALGRGALGALVAALAIGAATAIGTLAEARFGIGGMAWHALRALACSAVAVPLIVLLRRRLDRRTLAGLGLPDLRTGMRDFGLGALVTFGAAAAMLGLGHALGWLRFGAVSWPVLLTFVAGNAVIALFYEALPEELTLRGYAYRNLSAGLRRWTAALCTTLLFLAVPGLASVFAAGLATLVGAPAQAISATPAGQDPVAYLILLTVFGFALIVARVATGSLWTCIALHLSFLTINRISFFGDPDHTGWSAQMTTPDALLLVPGYLLLTAAIFLLLPRLQRRRAGWRSRDPEPVQT